MTKLIEADIEFPNDLLPKLDRMNFYVYETGPMVRANKGAIVIITSNNEKELPGAFLRRCFSLHSISRFRNFKKNCRGSFP